MGNSLAPLAGPLSGGVWRAESGLLIGECCLRWCRGGEVGEDMCSGELRSDLMLRLREGRCGEVEEQD